MDLETTHCALLQRYARPIVHMRKQIQMNRFGLVFGSGLSKSFGLPTWPRLVESIAADPRVGGESLVTRLSPRASLPYKTELLFQHFRRSRHMASTARLANTRRADYEIMAEWISIVAEHLYRDAPRDFAKAIIEHPYLAQFLPIIRRTPLTVTYNFDTFIENALTITRSPDDQNRSRGYEIVTNPWTQFRRNDAVIYHPNGVVPQELMEAPVDRIVFSEASYAEQLMGVMMGDHAGLLSHLSKNTCLFVGLSLEDEMLRNLLVQGARSNPGNYHYYVSYTDDDVVDMEHRQAVRLTNFKVYNLITLFLGDTELCALGGLLNLEAVGDDQFQDFGEEHGLTTAFRYYLTGPLGVGKSTSINHFRNLMVYDEWLEPRRDVLGKAWSELSEEERGEADRWVLRQFKLKNDNLRHGKGGIFIVDRPPLDPIAFTPKEARPAKARGLLEAICPGRGDWRVQSGQIIFLVGDPDELAVRMLLTKRNTYTADRLREMEDSMREIYEADGVVIVDTRGMSVPDVVRRVAEIIHLDDYQECNLHKRLQAISGNT